MPLTVKEVEHRYIPLKDGVIVLTQNEDGLWCDETGCIYAVREDSAMTDKVDRIGVWPFVFPFKTRLDDIYKVHDYLYSCPAYQFFHTREEADAWAREWHEAWTKTSWPLRLLAQPFYFLMRTFGGRYWENEKTRLNLKEIIDAINKKRNKGNEGNEETLRRKTRQGSLLRHDK